jgi:hypothetical protein
VPDDGGVIVNDTFQKACREADKKRAKKVLKFRKKDNSESAEQFANKMNAKFGNKINPQELFQKVERFLARFVCYPSDHAHVAHVLWVAHTHLMDAWDSTPRLAFLSAEPKSGKTRALEVSELLVPLPVEAVNVTPAYLFRKVGSPEGRSTILYDEIDTVFGPKAKENEEIRGLLNAGHRQGAVAGRCVTKGKNVETEEIPAYAAVALAGIGWLPDTLLSRCIIIRMCRRKPGERVEPFRRRIHAKEGHLLRDQLAALAVQVTITLPDDMPSGIEDRDADCWESLLAIADAIGGDWPERARKAAVALVAAAQEAEPSLGIRLLCDLRTIFSNAEAIPTADILAALHALAEAPWNDLKGRPLNGRGLAIRLRQYGVQSRNVRTGETIKKGYTRADLYDAWERYCPPASPSPGISATSATSATEPGFSGSSVADVADNGVDVADAERAKNRDEAAPVADVADVAGSGDEEQF